MRHVYSLLFVLIFFACLPLGLAAQESEKPATPRTFEMKSGDSTIIMKQYIMVLLKRGDQAETFTEEQLEEIQAGHMANIHRLEAMGKLIIAGPFGDDGELRGIFIFDCATVEEVEELVATDPAVMAGRLKCDIHPWWCMQGATMK